MRASHIVLLGVSAIAASAASAYEIGSGSIFKSAFDVHETITMLAQNCASSSARPTNCAIDPDILVRYSVKNSRAKMNPVQRAARWSDDPQRTLEAGGSAHLIAVTVGSGCGYANRQGNAIDERGIMCSSHYGQLQFLHAQDSYGAAAPDRRVTLGSREKMMDWAAFAFRAATDSKVATMTMCEAGDPTNGILSGDLRVALALGHTERCAIESTYTVGRFFSWQCGGPVARKCTDLSMIDPAVPPNAAQGAILHLIQDSFSQSHAARVRPNDRVKPSNGPFVAAVECMPIQRFYDYGQQRSSRHKRADRPPHLQASCFAADRPVDDVVTASANAIWYVEAGKSGDSANRATCQMEFLSYLKNRVLRLVFEPPSQPVVGSCKRVGSAG